MIDFELSSRARMIQDMARAFALNNIRPYARQADTEGKMPEEVIRQLASFGMVGGSMPLGREREELGAESEPKENNLLAVVGAEQMAYGDPAVIMNIPGPGLAAPAINAMGTPEQKERFLGIFQKNDGKLRYGAYAYTEAHFGSDTSQVATTAKRDGDEWVLNGRKIFCTNGARADIVVVFATVDKSLGREGIKAFVVEKGTPGFEVGKIEDKLGIKASETAELILDNVRVPMDNLLGGEAALDPKRKAGFIGAMKTFDSTRPMVAALALGIGQAAFDYVKEWVRTEIKAGYPFKKRTEVSLTLADAERELAISRHLIWRAAWMADRSIPNTREASMAKAYAPQAAYRVCRDAVRIMGPEGYSKEHLVEKWYRDIKIYDIFEGTGQIQRVVISRRILGYLDKDDEDSSKAA
ncbi:MAG: acyl-CoA dehydrogenase [Acidimicrobiia bacterium]